MNHKQLLARAAHCYQLAGLNDDACRLYLDLEDHRALAQLYQLLERWSLCAEAFQRSGDWVRAAVAHERAGHHAAAAEAWLRANRRLRAAWLLAQAGLVQRARALLEDYQGDDPLDELAVSLILARCELGHPSAARRLGQLLPNLFASGLSERSLELADWCRDLALSLARPDLLIQLHACGWRAGKPYVLDQWRTDAQAQLGDASAVPTQAFSAQAPGVYHG